MSATNNWQPSTLTWSFSRRSQFNACRRSYYYHRFWGQDPKLRWRIYEMRNITTLALLRGQVVHEVIAHSLKSAMMGVTTSAQSAKKEITQILRERYMESARKLWHVDNRPAGKKIPEVTNLLEHYYKYPNINERAKETQQIAWRCVENLMQSDIWREILESDSSTWRVIDDSDFASFDIDGIQVHARIDFAYIGDQPTIIDWKTSGPRSNDRMQLALYALYAQSKWEWDPLSTRLMNVYLYPELTTMSFVATQEELDDARAEVKRSFEQMMEVEPAFGPADIENFPVTQHKGICAWCGYQGICEAAKGQA